jgi:hypothetical protein
MKAEFRDRAGQLLDVGAKTHATSSRSPRLANRMQAIHTCFQSLLRIVDAEHQAGLDNKTHGFKGDPLLPGIGPLDTIHRGRKCQTEDVEVETGITP